MAECWLGRSPTKKTLRRRVLGHRHGRVIQPAKEQVSSLDPAGTDLEELCPLRSRFQPHRHSSKDPAHLSPSAPMDRPSRKDPRTSSNDSFLPGITKTASKNALGLDSWRSLVLGLLGCNYADIVVRTLASSEPRTSSGAPSDLQINKPACSS